MSPDSLSALPLSLYIHIPWCVRKCPYCDFNSHERRELPEQAYVDALLRDLDSELDGAGGRPLHSLFFGGGTPSLFSPEAMDSILRGVRQRMACKDAMEITLEANPGTLEAGKFAEFRAAGINRLSIGVQSFNADMLPRLGRIHNAEEAIRAAEQAHQAGFAEAGGFNLDLMFGLPGQSITEALEDIQTAIDLQPSHISHYQLTVEPGTAFFYRPPALPKDDDIWAMQSQCQAQLAAHGYGHYEVSAYAQPGKQCQHNLNYWQFGDYIGIGAGAHGKLTQADKIIRRSKLKTPEKYLRHAGQAACLDEHKTVSAEEQGFEFMLNALRLNDGFPAELFEQRCHARLATYQPQLQAATDKGLLEQSHGRIRATALGQRYLNELIGEFL